MADSGTDDGDPLTGQARDAALMLNGFSRQQLDTLLALISDVVVVIDPQGTIRYISPGVRRLLGFDPSSMLGRSLVEFLDPDSGAEILTRISRRQNNPEVGTTLRLRHAVEGWRDVIIFVSTHLTSGDSRYLVAVLRDATDRRHTLDALRHRLAFEDLLTRVASAFLNRPAHEFDRCVDEVLADIGSFARADRAYLYLLNRERSTVELTNLWCADGLESAAWDNRSIAQYELTEWLGVLRKPETIYIPRLADMPETWQRERQRLEPAGAQSVLASPLVSQGEVIGFVGFDSTRSERIWSDDHLSVLGSAANIIAQSLARSDAEQRFGLAFTRAPLGMALHASDGRHIQVNDAYCELLGRSEDELLDRPLLDFVHRDHHDEIRRRHRLILKGASETLVAEIRAPRPDGAVVWLRVHAAAVRAADGSLRYTVGHFENITERHRQELDLRRSEERYRSLVENSPALVVRVDRDFRLTYVSPAARDLVGSDVDQFIGNDRLFALGAEGVHWRRAIDAVLRTGRRHDREWKIRVNGQLYWFQSRAVPEFDNEGRVNNVLVLNTDITALKRTEEELVHQALHDPLTGLANRTLLRDHLDGALARASRRPGSLAVLFCDLDRFKLINDSMGHWAGDELLCEIARRLVSVVRPGDTVARLGGDEFVILLEDVREPPEPVRVAERVQRALAEPVMIDDTEVFTTTSIGIAVVADDHVEADDLLRDADAAMYLAKARGRDRYEIFDEILRTEATQRLKMENSLRRSLDLGGLLVHYQPEVQLSTGRLISAEALARWNHPTNGVLNAAAFIELAEETGLILDLGYWVLREACQQLGAWQRERPGRIEMMRVNLSARQIAQPDIVDRVIGAMEEGGVEPPALCLEITETALMDDPVASLKVLSDLRQLGVRLAIDDFGTGYSSLAYLKRFPVDVVKIDRSFVDGLGDDPEDTAIVAAIISMAGALGLDVVAEGVETARQLGELRRLGCDRAQGFLFAPAVAPEDFWTVAQSSFDVGGR
ncbi:MAG: EAL domain-containing protein [Acidimicrobiales bacterium]|nr:EAL domain-containing protein [Acidimicrobiales bacterium]